jgi:putative membrane protein
MHEIAVKDFHSLGMHKTKDRTGVLIFILFKQRYFDIVADSGIYEKIPNTVWNDMEAKTKHQFRHGNFGEQLLDIIDITGKLLAKEFPGKADDKNELSDEVVVS